MKAYKGLGMEGAVARWYTRTRANDMEGFRDQAHSVAAHLSPGARVLEVAPGPGFFAIQLATLGQFKITGLDISRTFVQIAQDNARRAGVSVDFRLGSASAMPFPAESFDFVYCSAAFKNFSAPVDALNEMHRVLRPGGEAWIDDLRKDVSSAAVDAYVRNSGRKGFDAWLTRWTFQHMLIKRAYTQVDLSAMSKQSQFHTCTITADGLGLRVRLTKPLAAA
jgi:ubiquinone/menaquinone biosynthesis C-methylase UbiE